MSRQLMLNSSCRARNLLFGSWRERPFYVWTLKMGCFAQAIEHCDKVIRLYEFMLNKPEDAVHDARLIQHIVTHFQYQAFLQNDCDGHCVLRVAARPRIASWVCRFLSRPVTTCLVILVRAMLLKHRARVSRTNGCARSGAESAGSKSRATWLQQTASLISGQAQNSCSCHCALFIWL